MIRLCAVVPAYNHEGPVGGVVSGLRRHGLPVYLVDDGSRPSCAAVLDAIAASDDGVRVVRLARNSGKGAAVMAGFEAAAAAGFTHALQIDADGQHALEDVPRFVALAQQRPDHVVCGQPLFDASVPRSRRYLRHLTHVMVWVNTLSLDVRDSMCGFRVYPLARVLPLIRAEPPGRRMDFDVEVLVRLHWRGVPVSWVPTRVIYPAGGVSQFRLFRDNVLITCMHTRLFFGMLWRAPRLLSRCRRSSNAAESRVSA
jgi:glycosyltransferase involved in cell wall biosynthesis